MFVRSSVAVPLFFLLAASLAAPQTPQSSGSAGSAQESPQAAPQVQPGYTFHTESRVVLTDVVVTDKQGKPVRGLSQSAFRVLDNNQPQPIGSFEEHVSSPGSPVPTASPVDAPKGTYSNGFLNHLPPVLDIIIIDVTNLEIIDQMYLNYQLTHFIKELPAGQSLAIYLRAGQGSVLLQNFTTDHALLQAAVKKAIPRFPPTGREYLSDLDTLGQMAVYLSQFPGHKNIMWFSGGSTLYLREDATVLENSEAWRNLYDELEKERIAVYPIDARGLTVGTGGRRAFAQHAVMNDVAHATGATAFYNTNGLKEAANRIIDTGGNFYTLTYSPQNFHLDNKWHKVRIEIKGSSYNLSYRTGYFADGNVGGPERQEKPRTRLMADGQKIEEPVLRSAPIIFEARVLPTADPVLASLPSSAINVPSKPPKRGAIPFSIRYTVPASAFTQDAYHDPERGDQLKLNFGVAVYAINREGRTVASEAERIGASVGAEFIRMHPDAPISINQPIDLEKGDEYLYLAVWDLATGRLGTLQISLDVRKTGKAKDETAKN